MRASACASTPSGRARRWCWKAWRWNSNTRTGSARPPAVGYETLIYDCLIGDATLFQRADQVEAAWSVVEPVLHGWESVTPRHFPNYSAGSEGPSAANDLLARDGR